MNDVHFEKKLKSEEKYNGKIIRVTCDTVLLENGQIATRDVVHHNGGAAVAALNDKGDIMLVRQFRYPFGRELLEIPAGKLDIDENPFLAAKRELLEETGLTAEVYIDLGYIIPTCGYCDEKIYIYGAKGLTKTQQSLDDDEFVSVESIALEKAAEMCLCNEISDSKTVAAILKLSLLRKSGEF